MTDRTDERRVRRMAARQQLVLQKKRRIDRRAFDYGTYQIVDAKTGAIVAAIKGVGYGLSLRECEDALTARAPFAEGGRS